MTATASTSTPAKAELPDFVRYADEVNAVYVMEFEPCYRGINLTNYDQYPHGYERFIIPVPWQVYICQPIRNKVQFFTRVQPLKNFNDTLNFPHLSNIYRDCEPCGGVPFGNGGSRYGEQEEQLDPVEYSVKMINYVWQSSFQGGFYLSEQAGGYGYSHHDLPGHATGSLLPKEITDKFGPSMYYGSNSKSYYQWVEQLKIDDILAWEWQAAGKLRSLLPHPVAAGSKLRRQ